MSRTRNLARRYWIELPIVLLAIDGMVEVLVRRDAPDAPTTTLWFAVPAIAVMVLPLFARRRFPFAAPVMFWLLAIAVTSVDGRLLAFTTSTFVLGMAVAFLLGNLRDARRARIGLALVLVAEVIIVYNIPGHPASQLFSSRSCSGSAGSPALLCASARSRSKQRTNAPVKPSRSGRRRRG